MIFEPDFARISPADIRMKGAPLRPSCAPGPLRTPRPRQQGGRGSKLLAAFRVQNRGGRRQGGVARAEWRWVLSWGNPEMVGPSFGEVS